MSSSIGGNSSPGVIPHLSSFSESFVASWQGRKVPDRQHVFQAVEEQVRLAYEAAGLHVNIAIGSLTAPMPNYGFTDVVEIGNVDMGPGGLQRVAVFTGSGFVTSAAQWFCSGLVSHSTDGRIYFKEQRSDDAGPVASAGCHQAYQKVQATLIAAAREAVEAAAARAQTPARAPVSKSVDQARACIRQQARPAPANARAPADAPAYPVRASYAPRAWAGPRAEPVLADAVSDAVLARIVVATSGSDNYGLQKAIDEEVNEAVAHGVVEGLLAHSGDLQAARDAAVAVQQGTQEARKEKGSKMYNELAEELSVKALSDAIAAASRGGSSRGMRYVG